MSASALLRAAACAVALGIAAPASGLPEGFVDPQDGRLDLSAYLAGRYGFLPVPVLITEPAVGFGGGIALAYFHPTRELDPGRHPHRGPPSISFLAGAGTENGTWFVGGGHSGVWLDDHVRYLGVLGSTSLTLDWYGLNDYLPGEPTTALQWTGDAGLAFQQVRLRVGESDWWVGLRSIYANAEIGFERPDLLPEEFADLRLEVDQGALGAVATTPTSPTGHSCCSTSRSDSTRRSGSARTGASWTGTRRSSRTPS